MAAVTRPAERATVPTFGQRVPLLLLGGVTLIAVATVGLLQVMQTSRAATIGYELRSLERERGALAAEVRLLEADIAHRSRIEQIRDDAVERLGMVRPEESLRITVGVAAPRVIPMPERYVAEQPAPPPSSSEWWERLLRRLPGFE